MYIYLDESYNLKDRDKKQVISINGFAVLDTRPLSKKWRDCRRPFVGGRRIHASDPTFNKLRLKVLRLIGRSDLILLTVFQIVQEIPFQKCRGYFYKGKLNFDKIYVDLLRVLLVELGLGEYRSVEIIVDSRKRGAGILSQQELIKQITDFLKQKYTLTRIAFKIQSSVTDVLLEFTDFISNIFYRSYIDNDKKFFEDLRFKMVQIKNPL
jgi:hypothetical protein